MSLFQKKKKLSEQEKWEQKWQAKTDKDFDRLLAAKPNSHTEEVNRKIGPPLRPRPLTMEQMRGKP